MVAAVGRTSISSGGASTPARSSTHRVRALTTPQQAAQRVAQRAAAMAEKVNLTVKGVIENMSFFTGDDGKQYEIFGSGGGQDVADSLTRAIGSDVPLLGQIPLDTRLRIGADQGMPVVLGEPDSPAAVALRGIAKGLGSRARGLAGRSLGLTPAGR